MLSYYRVGADPQRSTRAPAATRAHTHNMLCILMPPMHLNLYPFVCLPLAQTHTPLKPMTMNTRSWILAVFSLPTRTSQINFADLPPHQHKRRGLPVAPCDTLRSQFCSWCTSISYIFYFLLLVLRTPRTTGMMLTNLVRRLPGEKLVDHVVGKLVDAEDSHQFVFRHAVARKQFAAAAAAAAAVAAAGIVCNGSNQKGSCRQLARRQPQRLHYKTKIRRHVHDTAEKACSRTNARATRRMERVGSGRHVVVDRKASSTLTKATPILRLPNERAPVQHVRGRRAAQPKVMQTGRLVEPPRIPTNARGEAFPSGWGDGSAVLPQDRKVCLPQMRRRSRGKPRISNRSFDWVRKKKCTQGAHCGEYNSTSQSPLTP